MSAASRHGVMLKVFIVVMIGHWLEHIVQAYQVFAMGYERHHAMGVLGHFYPWLIHSEWLHFAYAVLTFVGLVILRGGFPRPALGWWNSALGIQVWHLLEHTLLFIQAQGGFTFWGAKEPTSVVQLLFPRIELHLFYNSIVTVPVVVAMVLSRRRRWQTSYNAIVPNATVNS